MLLLFGKIGFMLFWSYLLYRIHKLVSVPISVEEKTISLCFLLELIQFDVNARKELVVAAGDSAREIRELLKLSISPLRQLATFASKSLYNQADYQIRQVFLHEGKYLP